MEKNILKEGALPVDMDRFLLEMLLKPNQIIYAML